MTSQQTSLNTAKDLGMGEREQALYRAKEALDSIREGFYTVAVKDLEKLIALLDRGGIFAEGLDKSALAALPREQRKAAIFERTSFYAEDPAWLERARANGFEPVEARLNRLNQSLPADRDTAAEPTQAHPAQPSQGSRPPSPSPLEGTSSPPCPADR